MDSNALISKISAAAPQKLLEKGKLGRSNLPVAWVDLRGIRKIAETLKNDPEVQLDWLENLCVAEVEDALAISYLVRSTRTDAEVLIRGSIEPKSADAWVEVESVRDVWDTATPLEDEAAALFGIHFTDSSQGTPAVTRGLWPSGPAGFPLRKSFALVGHASQDAGEK